MEGRRVLAILSLLVLISPVGCGPSITDPVTAAIAGKSAQDVVSSAEYSARTVVQESQKAGSALMSQGANQLDVLAHNVEAQLDTDITKHVKELSEENRKLLYELEKMRQSTVALSAAAFRLKDSTILDLKDLSGDSWFAKKHSYWVQRVSGLSQVLNPSGAEYEVSVLGIGFGTDTDDRKTKVLQVAVAGKSINTRINESGIYATEIYFSNDDLKPFFDDHTLKIVPLSIQTSVSEKHFTGWSTPAKHELSLWLSLMPRYGGSVIINYSHPVKDWVKTSDTPSVYSYIGPNCHRDDTKRPRSQVSTSTSLQGDQRFVGPTSWRAVTGPGCDYNHDQVVSITQNGKVLTFGMTCDGSGCNFEYSAFIEELKPVRHEEATILKDLVFDDYLVVEFPPDTDFWTVTGKTSTLQPIHVLADQPSDILEQKSKTLSGDVLRVVYFVHSPPS